MLPTPSWLLGEKQMVITPLSGSNRGSLSSAQWPKCECLQEDLRFLHFSLGVAARCGEPAHSFPLTKSACHLSGAGEGGVGLGVAIASMISEGSNLHTSNVQSLWHTRLTFPIVVNVKTQKQVRAGSEDTRKLPDRQSCSKGQEQVSEAFLPVLYPRACTGPRGPDSALLIDYWVKRMPLFRPCHLLEILFLFLS